MNKIFFISDLFYHLTPSAFGGAEKCNDVLINEFFGQKYNDFENYMFVTLESRKLKPEIISKNLNSTFFVSNFMTLSEECKNTFLNNNIDYIIIEHDHKYLKSNNPALYKNFLCNEDELQNIQFYKNARAVLCQTNFACQILYKNTQLTNLINLGGNLWSEEEIYFLNEKLKNSRKPHERENRWAVLNTNNPNKGVPETVQYCNDKKICVQLHRSADI